MSQPNKGSLVQDIFMHCITFLIADTEKLFDFCQQNGCDINDIKNSLSDKLFQAAVLDYFLNNQAVAFELFKAKNVNPKEFIKARHQLPGADIELISL